MTPTSEETRQESAAPPDQATCDHVVGLGTTGGTIFPDLVKQSEAARGAAVVKRFDYCSHCGAKLAG